MEPIQQQLSNIRATLQNLSGQEREAAFGILQKIVEECKSTQDLAADTPHASHSSAADGDGISNEADGSSSYEERKGKIFTDLSRDDHAYYASVPRDRNASLAVQKQETSEAHTLSEEQTEQRFGSTDVERVAQSDESRQQKEPVCAQKERDIHDVVNAVFDVASEVDVITDSLSGDQAAEPRKHSSELGESRDNKNSPTIEMENGKMEVVEKNCSSADDAGKIDISKSVDQTFKGENRTLRDDEKTDGVLRCSARGRKTRDEAGKQANEKPITEDKAPPLRTSKRKGRPPKKFASSASDDLSSNLKNQTEKYENEPRPKRRRFPSRYIKEDEDFINSDMEDSKKA